MKRNSNDKIKISNSICLGIHLRFKDIKSSPLMKFHVDSDITIAETLPAHFYKSQEVFDLLKEKVFVKSWQWIGDAHMLVPQPETVSPLVL